MVSITKSVCLYLAINFDMQNERTMKKRPRPSDTDESKAGDRDPAKRQRPPERCATIKQLSFDLVDRIATYLSPDAARNTLCALSNAHVLPKVAEVVDALEVDMETLVGVPPAPRLRKITIADARVPSAFLGWLIAEEHRIITDDTDDADELRRLERMRRQQTGAWHALQHGNRWCVDFSRFPALKTLSVPKRFDTQPTLNTVVNLIRGLATAKSSVTELRCGLYRKYSVLRDVYLNYGLKHTAPIKAVHAALASCPTQSNSELLATLRESIASLSQLHTLVLQGEQTSRSLEVDVDSFLYAPRQVTLQVTNFFTTRGGLMDAFQRVPRLSDLRKLTVTGYTLQPISDRDCTAFIHPNLTTLHLNFNANDCLCSDDTLRSFSPTLTDVQLQFLTANEVTPRAFERFALLKGLLLGGVWRGMDDEAFEYLTSLTELRLIGCHMRISPHAFSALRTLKSLTISCCLRAYLTPAVLPALVELVEGGQLRHIHWMCCFDTVCCQQRHRSCCFDATFSNEDIEAVFGAQELPADFRMTVDPCKSWRGFCGGLEDWCQTLADNHWQEWVDGEQLLASLFAHMRPLEVITIPELPE